VSDPHTDSPTLTIGGTTFRWGERTYVMGIVNVTPDSFSGDGLMDAEDSVAAAVAQAQQFAADGADMLDVGGESTRPGAHAVEADEERARVVPVIAALARSVPLPISVDTSKAAVAEAALDAGAHVVNDVWGLRRPDGGWNDELTQLVAARGVPVVLMHNRRAPPAADAVGGHYTHVAYDDLVPDIIRDLDASIEHALDAGIARYHIIVDPGIGFGKTPAQNIELMRHLAAFKGWGLPVLLGTSRKSFIGKVLDAPPSQRVEGTAATVVLGIQAGVDIVRVHDVAPIVRAARMTDAIVRPGGWERALAGNER
jgi:dihydropteroate synthase